MKKAKYTYWRILQSNHGYGWDDVQIFNSNSTPQERKKAMREYRENQPQARHRFIDRQELNA